jgi:hypothetical protein
VCLKTDFSRMTVVNKEFWFVCCNHSCEHNKRQTPKRIVVYSYNDVVGLARAHIKASQVPDPRGEGVPLYECTYVILLRGGIRTGSLFQEQFSNFMPEPHSPRKYPTLNSL